MKTIQFILTILFAASSLFGYSQSENDLVRFKENDHYGFKNIKGDIVVETKYDYVWDFSEGLAKIIKNGKYGFINKEGKVIIPLIYNKAELFQNGKAKVKLNGEWFYIDANVERVKLQ